MKVKDLKGQYFLYLERYIKSGALTIIGVYLTKNQTMFAVFEDNSISNTYTMSPDYLECPTCGSILYNKDLEAKREKTELQLDLEQTIHELEKEHDYLCEETGRLHYELDQNEQRKNSILGKISKCQEELKALQGD